MITSRFPKKFKRNFCADRIARHPGEFAISKKAQHASSVCG